MAGARGLARPYRSRWSSHFCGRHDQLPELDGWTTERKRLDPPRPRRPRRGNQGVKVLVVPLTSSLSRMGRCPSSSTCPGDSDRSTEVASSSARTLARARCTRVLAVAVGMPTASAISLGVSPSQAVNVNTSRSISSRVASAARTQSWSGTKSVGFTTSSPLPGPTAGSGDAAVRPRGAGTQHLARNPVQPRPGFLAGGDVVDPPPGHEHRVGRHLGRIGRVRGTAVRTRTAQGGCRRTTLGRDSASLPTSHVHYVRLAHQRSRVCQEFLPARRQDSMLLLTCLIRVRLGSPSHPAEGCRTRRGVSPLSRRACRRCSARS